MRGVIKTVFLVIGVATLLLGLGLLNVGLTSGGDWIWGAAVLIPVGLIVIALGVLLRADDGILTRAFRIAGMSGGGGVFVWLEREHRPESKNEARLRRSLEREGEEAAMNLSSDSTFEERMAARRARLKKARREGRL